MAVRDEFASGTHRTRKEKDMSEVKVGDLVQWEAGDKVRVGVVKSVNQDGTCTLSVQGKAGSTEQTVRSERLTTIASTTEPAE